MSEIDIQLHVFDMVIAPADCLEREVMVAGPPSTGWKMAGN